MSFIVPLRLSLLVPLLMALLFVFGNRTPVAAQDGQCFQNLRICYQRAAFKASFWEMWAAGLDCELDVVDCVRRKVIGRE